MNKIHVFLVCLMICWFWGFIYIFWSNIDSRQRHKTNNINLKQDDLAAKIEYYESSKIDGNFKLNLKKLINDLHELEIKNKKNEDIIIKLRKVADSLQMRNLSIQSSNTVETKEELLNDFSSKKPTISFEQIRRKLFEDTKDLKYYLDSHFKQDNILKDNSEYSDHFKRTVDYRIDLLLVELYNLSKSNNFGEWRESESIKLSNRIQKRFHEQQNPADCSEAKKLICDLNKSCGYGCQIHHALYCFITAFYTNRTMILQSDNWRYDKRGFTAYFLPISETCFEFDKDDYVDWNKAIKENFDQIKNIKLPVVDSIANKPTFFPLSIPKEFHKEMELFHGNPFVWWAGQILKYLTRFNNELIELIKKATKDLEFKNSCVGVHVRRTDKIGTEAAFHDLKEYMDEVEKFYNIKQIASEMAGKSVEKCVYLASDEITVLKEANKQYPDYKFIYIMQNAKTASLTERYTSAQGIILDIYFLSQCEFLVCTFSSQVCRMAYEYMQTRFPDASWRFKSLDDIYYYGGGNGHNVVTRINHYPRKGSDEIELKIGDQVGIAGNHWNGFSKGRNLRTGRVGLFPSFKVKDLIQVY